MFVFIDEAGNTGKKVSDKEQPLYSSLGIVSPNNLDYSSAKTLNRIRSKFGIDELHGVEVFENINEIALPIRRELQKQNVQIALCTIEKVYMAYAKFFDIVFDSFENKGARTHIYQIPELRLLLFWNFTRIASEQLMIDFYENCLFARESTDAIEVFRDVCQKTQQNVEILDDRSQELILDTLSWAEKNPEEITTHEIRKTDRWKHLPNMSAFTETLFVASRFAKSRRSKVQKVVHDQQQQMQKVFVEMHGNLDDDKIHAALKHFFNVELEVEELRTSSFEMKDSKYSNGLQVADICLYCISRGLKNGLWINENKNVEDLIKFLDGRIYVHDLSFDTLNKNCKNILETASERRLSDEEWKTGQEFVEKAEDYYKKRLLSP